MKYLLLSFLLVSVSYGQDFAWPMWDVWNSDWVWTVNSNYGDHRPTTVKWHFHDGIDIQENSNGLVAAIKEGKVIYVGNTSVWIQHGTWSGDNFTGRNEYSFYTHFWDQSHILVRVDENDKVKPNPLPPYSYIGDGAQMILNHLHFSLMKDFIGTIYNDNDSYTWLNPFRKEFTLSYDNPNDHLYEYIETGGDNSGHPKFNEFFVELEASSGSAVGQWDYLHSVDYEFLPISGDNFQGVDLTSHDNNSEIYNPRFIIASSDESGLFKIYLNANDDFRYSGNNGTPEKITVIVDGDKFYELNFREMIGPDRFEQAKVYSEVYPLNSGPSGSSWLQYYKLFIDTDFDNPPHVVYAEDWLFDPLYRFNLSNLHYGQHNIKIILEDMTYVVDETHADSHKEIKNIDFYFIDQELIGGLYIDYCWSDYR